MDRIYSAADKAFSEIEHVAIAIGRTSGTQNHVALLHRSDDAPEVLMLELAWHFDLRNNSARDKYLWVDPNIHTLRKRQIAAQCRMVWSANKADGIPYALSEPSDCFDEETAAFLLGPTKHGLTCASFVLAVFHLAGLPLVRYETWPSARVDDIRWQEYVIQSLQTAAIVPQEHVELVKSQAGAVRYRPEEVSGAAALEPLPAEFSSVLPVAEALLERLSTEVAQ